MNPESSVLFVDAYDSFSENIIALLRQELHVHITVIRIDTVLNDPPSFFQTFKAIVLGPGPGNPDNETDTGLFNLVWKHAAECSIPVLGICLGFQSLCVYLGLAITRLGRPCHGHAKQIRHKNEDIFKNVGEIVATCYNSLGIQLDSLDTTPDASRPSSSGSGATGASQSASFVAVYDFSPHAAYSLLASDEDGYVMSIKHNQLPFWGVQFHPESCKSSEGCKIVLQNWWRQVRARSCCMASSNMAKLLDSPKEAKPLGSDMQTIHSPVFDAMQTQLRALNNAVNFERVAMSFDRQRIADLCQSLSRPESIVMLESTKRGHFSIYAFPSVADWDLEYKNSDLLLSFGQGIIARESISISSALEMIEGCLANTSVRDGELDVPFWGGFIGFFSYEAGLDLLNVSTTDNGKSRTVPDFSLRFVERSMVIDHQNNTLTVQSIRRNDEAWIANIAADVRAWTPTPPSTPARHMTPTEMTQSPSHPDYISRIRSCQSSLHAGDSYELCLTTTATLTSPDHSYALYTSLQRTNPAPYAAYLQLNNTTLLSSSPEQFLSWARHTPHLNMLPMKGTLPKSSTIDSLQRASELLLTPKEEAENLMIVDLIRHDLHSSLGPDGIVTVEKLFEIVETETLYQLISHIRGHIPIPPDTSEGERRKLIMRAGHKALRHSLPAGSMTGAPKKRSCEILRQLEGRNRGVYSGVFGYFDIGGGGGWSVGIRCAYTSSTDSGGEAGPVGSDAKGPVREWHVGAGGAITVLSEEEKEWEEMRAKMSSVLRGLGVEE